VVLRVRYRIHVLGCPISIAFSAEIAGSESPSRRSKWPKNSRAGVRAPSGKSKP